MSFAMKRMQWIEKVLPGLAVVFDFICRHIFAISSPL